jgi:hypothetical protein
MGFLYVLIFVELAACGSSHANWPNALEEETNTHNIIPKPRMAQVILTAIGIIILDSDFQMGLIQERPNSINELFHFVDIYLRLNEIKFMQ